MALQSLRRMNLENTMATEKSIPETYIGLRSVGLRDLIAIIRMAARSYNTSGNAAQVPERIAEDAYATADEMMKRRAV